jgi:hypothetical protein
LFKTIRPQYFCRSDLETFASAPDAVEGVEAPAHYLSYCGPWKVVFRSQNAADNYDVNQLEGKSCNLTPTFVSLKECWHFPHIIEADYAALVAKFDDFPMETYSEIEEEYDSGSD